MYVETGAKVVVDSAFGKSERSSMIKLFASNLDKKWAALTTQ